MSKVMSMFLGSPNSISNDIIGDVVLTTQPEVINPRWLPQNQTVPKVTFIQDRNKIPTAIIYVFEVQAFKGTIKNVVRSNWQCNPT